MSSGATGLNLSIPIFGAAGGVGATGVFKGLTVFTVILGGVTVIGFLTISLGLTEAPSSICAIGSC